MNTEINISKACERANHVCDKSQYKEASILEKIKLTIHLAFCSACRKYSKNNKKLSVTIEKAKVDCMHKDEKDALKENLTQAIKEHQN
jgi:NMD protein affecting ribosome stability and mRNA decay